MSVVVCQCAGPRRCGIPPGSNKGEYFAIDCTVINLARLCFQSSETHGHLFDIEYCGHCPAWKLVRRVICVYVWDQY